MSLNSNITKTIYRGKKAVNTAFKLTFFITILVFGLLFDTFAPSTSPVHNAAFAKDTIAKSARLGGDIKRTRFVADLSRAVKFRIFTLAKPYRIIIDMPNVNFRMPEGIGKKGRGLVSAYRYGLFAPGKSRIVIDLKQPVRIDKSFVLPAKNNQPARLVVDLVPTDHASYMAALNKGGRKNTRKTARAVPLADPGKRAKSRKVKPVIVIDPGHGGVDPGAISPQGTKEKQIVLAFSKLLYKRLKNTGQFRVFLTRDIDIFIPLRNRVKIAREKGAALFISVHADSIPRRVARRVRGATVYTLSEKASDQEAKLLAAKENRSDIIAGVELPRKSDEVTNILIDLAQRETKNYSITFANLLVGHLNKAVKQTKDPLRFADFRVLKAPDVPSVLLELGFLSNPNDEKLLKSRKWNQKVATTVTKAIQKYFALQVARTPFRRVR